MESWENARDTAEDMMGIDDYENFTLEESKVKLIVDGMEIPLIDNADSVAVRVKTDDGVKKFVLKK